MSNSFRGKISGTFNIIKKHFLPIVAVTAAYAAAHFIVYAGLTYLLEYKLNIFFKAFVVLLQLSFISLLVFLFSENEFSMKKIVPGIKYIVYSVILYAVVNFLFIPLKLIVKALPEFPSFFGAPETYFYGILYYFISVILIMFILFCVFEFLLKPSVDEPVLNSRDIFKNNIFFISIISLIIAVFAKCVPAATEGVYSFVIQLFFCVFCIAAYFSLKPETKIEQKKPESVTADSAPKIKMDI